MSDKNAIPLGKFIYGDAEKDAVHIAIAPAIAGEELKPGDFVALTFGGTHYPIAKKEKYKPIGIVDPFLPRHVVKNEEFYVCLFPGTITSLRHDWTHPAFPDPRNARLEIKSEIEAFAELIDVSYEELMEKAGNFVFKNETIAVFSSDNVYAASTSEWEQFWKNYKLFTGVHDFDESQFTFRCAC